MKTIQYIALFIALVSFLTCNMYEPEDKSGAIVIQFVNPQQTSLAKPSQTEELLFSVRCVLTIGEKKVHDRYYSKADTSFHIEIRNLQPSENYGVLLYGRNELGCPIGRAQKDSVAVLENQVATLQLSWEKNLERGTVTDIDGNVYETVRIGDQWWMVENLQVTHYRNGDLIPEVRDAREWDALETGAWCTYDNDPANAETYGLLYNWFAVNDPRDIAPDGWRVPSDDDWKQLEMTLGMDPAALDGWGFRGTDEGNKMKAIGTLDDGTGLWTSPSSGATNESCFSALPGGWRIYTGVFYSIGNGATFWSSTEYGDVRAWSRSLNHEFAHVIRTYGFKGRGFSIRCVKN